MPFRRFRPARAMFVTLLFGVGGSPGPAWGADGDPAVGIPIAGDSACPRPETVWSELATLLPPERLGETVHAAGALEIVDLGPSFRVTAAGRVREYKDEGRGCPHRARVAAVFVALALAPATLMVPRPPPAPPQPVAPPPAVPVIAATPPAVEALVRVDLGAAVDAGIGADGSAAHVGAALRVAAGRGRVGLVAGTAAFIPVETSVGGIRLRQWRLPVDAGIRVRFPPGWIAPYAEAGVCAALLSERALELGTARAQSGVELGVRAAVGAHLPTRSRVGPFAALQAELVGRPLTIFALPRGEAGTTPLIWIGAAVGASMGLP